MNTTTIILLSIAVFLVIVMLLVGLLVFVRNKLIPQGKVKITINDKKDVEVQPGSSLLTTLANEQIFLPSACGGKGNCGQCRCRVVEGGGTIPCGMSLFLTKTSSPTRSITMTRNTAMLSNMMVVVFIYGK